MTTAIQYLARSLASKTNEIFERKMQYAAQKICERQSLFRDPAA
jgi:hypothetical protein